MSNLKVRNDNQASFTQYGLIWISAKDMRVANLSILKQQLQVFAKNPPDSKLYERSNDILFMSFHQNNVAYCVFAESER